MMMYNRARKSCRTLQNKIRINVVPVQLARFVNMFVAFKKCIIQWGTRSTNPSRYSSWMALWFVSYATSPITVTIYDVKIVIVYDVTLLLSMTYHFQSRLGKTHCMDMGNKTEKRSIAIYRISGPPLFSTILS